MNHSFVRSGISTAFLGLALVACGDATSVDTHATLNILLTDAPSDYIGEAMVDIGTVELLGAEGGPVVLTEDGTDGPVNLLDLQNAATMALARVEIEAGTYTQLRLVVESASVTLADGEQFAAGGTSADLTVPSGAQTGIKLNLSAGDAQGNAGGIDIVPGEMVLVVDFDVNQSYVLQGNPGTPAGISGVSFQPTLRVVVDDVAGSISGTISTQVPGLAVEGLVVTAEPVEGTTLEPFQTVAATATTDATGAYTLLFLVPGNYEISVDPGDGLTAAPVMITVGEGADITGTNLEVVEG